MLGISLLKEIGLILLLVIYFGVVLCFSTKRRSKIIKGTVGSSSMQITKIIHSNNNCPDIKLGFINLHNNKSKLSNHLNSDLKGYISI